MRYLLCRDWGNSTGYVGITHDPTCASKNSGLIRLPSGAGLGSALVTRRVHYGAVKGCHRPSLRLDQLVVSPCRVVGEECLQSDSWYRHRLREKC